MHAPCSLVLLNYILLYWRDHACLLHCVPTADWLSDICPVWTQLPWSSWSLNALLEVLMVVGWWTESVTHSPVSHRHTGCLPVRGLGLKRWGCRQSVGLCRGKKAPLNVKGFSRTSMCMHMQYRKSFPVVVFTLHFLAECFIHFLPCWLS